MLKVDNTVKCYEVDGNPPASAQITVRSHWNRCEMVEVIALNGTRVTVLAADLKAAIENAQNTGAR